MTRGDGSDASTEASERPPRPRRRWPWWLLAGLGLLLLAGALAARRAPAYVKERLEAELSGSWAATVDIERVDIHWSRLAVDIHRLRLDDDVRLEVDVERLEARVRWSDLRRGALRPAIVIHRPAVSFQARPAPPREPSQRGLRDFASVDVVDGSIEIALDTSRGPAFLDVDQIDAQLQYRDLVPSSAAMDLGVELSARVGDAGRLTTRGRLSSSTPAQLWSFRFTLEGFALSPLNQLWLDIIEMDVEHGTLDLTGELTRSPSRLRGRVRPRFEDIALLGADEVALHPMAEALFGHMLMGATSTISIDRVMSGDPDSSLPELLQTDWQTIIQRIIRQGYARRLSRLEGFTATIGDVRADFSQGLLQLYEVVVDSEDPVIDVPLVQIARVDVVFDQAVTDLGAAAYKHVTLWEPTLTFATGVEGSNNQLQFDESWLDTISAIPFETRDLVVHRGRIDLWDLRSEEPIDISVRDIELEGHQMARQLHPAGVRGATLSGTGTVLGKAQASFHLVYEPRPVAPNLDADLKIEPVALIDLAPMLQTFAGVDAVGGQVGFSSHISVRDQAVEASVIPDVQRPKLRALEGRRIRKLIIDRALRRLRSHMITLRYSMEPDEGVFNQFFPQLIQAIFLGR